MTRLTGAVVAAMEAEGTRRLVMVSAAPVIQPPPDEPLTARLTLAVVRQVFGEVYADLAGAEALLARSGTEWTAVRPPRLTDGPLTATYRRVTGANPRACRSLSPRRHRPRDAGRRRRPGHGPPGPGRRVLTAALVRLRARRRPSPAR
ncbi:NAD(P)H-binding protein [Streptomyces albidoflavus]